MFHRNQDALFNPRYLLIWMLLAMQGGFLNTAGFLGVGRFVSHLTGFGTMVGVEIFRGHGLLALGLIATPVFFLFGSIFSGWFVERRRIQQELPWYSFIFFYIVFWLILVVVIGELGGFGTFGNHLDSMKNFYFLFTIAFICGMQNAVVSSATGNIIRTTHLTGPMTDLGTGFVRIWTFRKDRSKKKEFYAVWCRLGMILSFVVGSFIGAYLLTHFQYRAFLFPVIISLFASFELLNVFRKKDL